MSTMLVKTNIKLILIFLSNSLFNFFMKMKNEKWAVFRFPFLNKNEKRMRPLKIQSKNLLNMNSRYFDFVFHIEVKTKSKYKSLNLVFHLIKNTTWHFGYTDSFYLEENWKLQRFPSFRFCPIPKIENSEILEI